MKGLLLAMVFLLLCSTQVLSLRCYTCAEDDSSCKTPTDCEPEQGYCRTVVEDDTIYRTCEEFCDEDDFTSCCEQDLCLT